MENFTFDEYGNTIYIYNGNKVVLYSNNNCLYYNGRMIGKLGLYQVANGGMYYGIQLPDKLVMTSHNTRLSAIIEIAKIKFVGTLV